MDTTIKRYSMYIDGEFVDAPSTMSVVNPATEKIISEVPQATQEHINTAVLAAQKAQPAWAKLPAIKRASYLHETATAIRTKRDYLAKVIAEEQGKVLPLALVEVDFTADYLDYMA